jgi:hypothetical protein
VKYFFVFFHPNGNYQNVPRETMFVTSVTTEQRKERKREKEKERSHTLKKEKERERKERKAL